MQIADRIINRNSGEDGAQSFLKYLRFKKRFIAVLFAVVLLSLFLSLGVGKYGLGLLDALEIIWNRITIGPTTDLPERILFEDRIPRAFMAVTVGGGLAVAGAVMQSMLHNPLADPYTTGVSSGAGFGAALTVVLGLTFFGVGGRWGLVMTAFLMSLIPAFVIMVLSIFKKISATTVILVGIGIMYMFSALTQLLKVIATPQQMQMLYLWQLGSISECTMNDVLLVFLVCLLCCGLLYRYRSDLNLLSVGDKPAVTMGTDPWKVRMICLVIVSFMTAVVVSFTGVIGFVGLVAPQMVRIFIGSDNRYLIPASAVFGASFLIICDCLGRIMGSTGVPVGVITAVIGSPLFLYLLIKRSKKITI